jgi:enoyl-CoA hydratase
MPVLSERNGAVVTLTLTNPPRLFQDRPMVDALDAKLAQLERDSTVRAIIITGGHPRAFLTHYDVDEILSGARVTPDLPVWFFGIALRTVGFIHRLPGGRRLLNNPATRGLQTVHLLQQLYLRMNRMDKPIIAAINGTAAAGGCELALACDIRIMADADFTIGLTEPALGFNPGGGGGQRMARALGTARAVEMLLEARHCSPQEALEVGLVHRIVPPEELMAEVQKTAARLARRSPRAVWASKRAVYWGAGARWPRSFRFDQTGFVWAAVSPVQKRAMEFFLEQIKQTRDGVPSPWHDPESLRQWQEGVAFDFSDTERVR